MAAIQEQETSVREYKEPEFKQETKIQIVNRDGDWSAIECPDCHSFEIKSFKAFRCKDCGQCFLVYLEDGHKTITVKTDFGSPVIYKDTPPLVKESNGTYLLYWPKDEDFCAKNRGEKLKVGKDLRNGKDCHGHELYRRCVFFKQ